MDAIPYTINICTDDGSIIAQVDCELDVTLDHMNGTLEVDRIWKRVTKMAGFTQHLRAADLLHPDSGANANWLGLIGKTQAEGDTDFVLSVLDDVDYRCEAPAREINDMLMWG